ncbi:MAG: leishmanolysin-related zinc metalloendopeptidase [Pseudomonadota bacterium]
MSLFSAASALRTSFSDDGSEPHGFELDLGGSEATMPARAVSYHVLGHSNDVDFVFGAGLALGGNFYFGILPGRFRTTDTYTSGSEDGSDFNITINFRGRVDEELKQAFVDAADLISSFILSDIPDAFLGGLGILRDNTVDDVTITASVVDIDGEGGVLGQAGPTATRVEGGLPATGFMQFDEADAFNFNDAGLFNDIVFHEMMHVVGYGTIWDALGLVTENLDGTADFNGANVAIAFAEEFGSGTPAIETEGGPGTAGGHWNEAGTDGTTFDNEIMTGFINENGNYLSNMTIASLEDLGYDTVFDSSNPLDATSGLDLSIFNDLAVT